MIERKQTNENSGKNSSSLEPTEFEFPPKAPEGKECEYSESSI